MKKGLFFTCIIILLFITTGCDYETKKEEIKEEFGNRLAQVSVPFEWFKLEKESSEEFVIPEISGLTLETLEIPREVQQSLRKNLNILSETLKSETSFYQIAHEQSNIRDHITPTIGSSSMDWMELENIIQELGNVDYQFFHSFSIRGIGQLEFKGVSDYVAFVDMNAVNDTEDFHIVPLEVRVSYDGKILSIVQRENAFDSAHTVKELSDDSFVFDNTHLLFLEKWEQLQKHLKSIDDSEESVKDKVIEIGLKHGIRDNADALVELFEKVHQDHDFDFTAYLFDDRNLSSETFYELTLSTEDGYYTYTVLYNRGTKEISGIKKGSFLNK